jgi:hypothetical protein
VIEEIVEACVETSSRGKSSGAMLQELKPSRHEPSILGKDPISNS